MDEMQSLNVGALDVALLGDRLATDGYLLIRNLVSEDIATSVAEEALSVLQKERYVTPGPGSALALRLPSGRAMKAVGSRLQHIEMLHKLGWHPELRRLAEALLGETAYTQPRKMLEALFPARLGDEPRQLHRDNLGGPWCRDMLTFRVSLGGIGMGDGGIAVLRGSQDYHHALTAGPAEVQDQRIAVPDDTSDDWVTTELSPGDVVLFHCYTIHKVLPNRTDRVQLSTEYRWQSDSYPIHVGALLPHNYFYDFPDVPGWAELSADWRDTRWSQYPDGTKITYSRWPNGHQVAVPASRLVRLSPEAREYWDPRTMDTRVYLDTPHELPKTFKPGSYPIPTFTAS
jgi:hypothetical protein